MRSFSQILREPQESMNWTETAERLQDNNNRLFSLCRGRDESDKFLKFVCLFFRIVIYILFKEFQFTR